MIRWIKSGKGSKVRLAGLLFFVLPILAGAMAAGCDNNDTDVDDDDDDGGSFTPEPFCQAEQACWDELAQTMLDVDTESDFNAHVNAFYVCLKNAGGCHGTYLTCIEGCGQDGDCLTGCDQAHQTCLDADCGWSISCFTGCYENFANCDGGCPSTSWPCKQHCYADYADCITYCW